MSIKTPNLPAQLLRASTASSGCTRQGSRADSSSKWPTTGGATGGGAMGLTDLPPGSPLRGSFPGEMGKVNCVRMKRCCLLVMRSCEGEPLLRLVTKNANCLHLERCCFVLRKANGVRVKAVLIDSFVSSWREAKRHYCLVVEKKANFGVQVTRYGRGPQVWRGGGVRSDMATLLVETPLIHSRL